MAGHHPFLRSLRAILRTLDDEALAALANKGLLRRAQKDLEAAKPAIVAAEAGLVRLQVADAAVEVPELPAKSKCNCPATGICRHILSALLFLRDDSELAELDSPTQGQLFDSSADTQARSASEGEPLTALTPADILANVTDEELQKWAGKATFRKAQKALAAIPQVEIAAGTSLVVRFPTRNITCRWIPSGGLLGMVCSCQAETVCEHVVTAVLAYQASLGKRQVAAQQTALEESAGAPRTRSQVLESVGGVLSEMLSLGLARLSAATGQRLTTLAVSAHGVDLPRLERMLAGLAQEIDLTLKRDAQASTAILLDHAARVEALRTGLITNPRPALVGQHRSAYHEVGQITLIGLGAQRWRSKGGYHGVTVYFWDESAKDWATWSDSRPVDQPGFDPAGRFRSDGPWAGCNSPQDASRSVLRLTGAYRNPQARLSGRPATRALVTGPTLARRASEGFPVVISNWSELSPRVRQAFGGGLSERGANRDLVLLAPAAFGPASYDPLRQELTRLIFDDAGRMLKLWLPFMPEYESAVDLLEKLQPEIPPAVFGALRLVAGRVCVQPISLISDDKIVHLNLDQAPAGTGVRSQGPGAAADADDEQLDSDDEPELQQVGAGSALSRLLVTAQAELEALAENGLAARRDLSLLVSIAKRLDALGLTACARPLARLGEQLTSSAKLADPEHRQAAAGTVLHAYYVLRLAGEQESVAAATATLA